MAASQEAVGNSLAESLVPPNPALTQEQRAAASAVATAVIKRLQERMQAELRKSMNVAEEVVALLAPVYADYFSTSEMHKLIEFYETPLGRKVAGAAVAVQPDVSKKMQADLLPRMMAVMERVVRDEQGAMMSEMGRAMEEILKKKP
jgi:hypothetical protein